MIGHHHNQCIDLKDFDLNYALHWLVPNCGVTTELFLSWIETDDVSMGHSSEWFDDKQHRS